MDEAFGDEAVVAEAEVEQQGNGEAVQPPAPVFPAEGMDEALFSSAPAPAPMAPLPNMVLAAIPDPIRIWREKNYERMELKEKEARILKEQAVMQAIGQRDTYYEDRDKVIATSKTTNRLKEEAEHAIEQSDNVWEEVTKLVDTSTKAEFPVKDCAKMKNIFSKLKHHPLVKSA